MDGTDYASEKGTAPETPPTSPYWTCWTPL